MKEPCSTVRVWKWRDTDTYCTLFTSGIIEHIEYSCLRAHLLSFHTTAITLGSSATAMTCLKTKEQAEMFHMDTYAQQFTGKHENHSVNLRL